ncbi:type I pullulanase [Streptococcus sp. E29BA]|uniref:type I pullulanase n=1 Tax=Streptococcus sp. E29BA TaxID=3278716 RepID=UPI00359E44AA
MVLENRVTVHFHSRYKNYFDLNLWQWRDFQEGKEAHFQHFDSFGAVANLTYPAPYFLPKVYVMIKTKNWGEKTSDYAIHREFGMKKTEIWLVDGDEMVYYSRQAAVASPHYGRRQPHAYDMAVNSRAFDHKWGFSGWLGARYSPDAAEFRLWAPTAERVELIFYQSTEDRASVREVFEMERGQVSSPDDHQQNTCGVWFATIPGDHNYQAYRYRIYYRKRTFKHSRDPYATATTADGKRSVLIAPEELVPTGFEVVHGAAASWRLDNPNQAVIMEMHIRDFSKSPTSGISPEHRGKYLGAIEKGTINQYGDKTGFDYVTSLGVNYIQLQPVFDHHQTFDDEGNYAYNWGYDPENYNVPEASFASNPHNPATRILELKQVIQAYHEAGIGVILDVVYNHTYSNRDSAFQLTVPDYYYRMTANGSFHNGSGCGNETASDKEMFRKYMIDSILYWIKEYGVDGFRFDLMGLHDVETMNVIRQAVDEVDPRILLYGEGWDMGTGLIPEAKAKKANAHLMPGVGFFNDDQRDAIKGAEVYGDFKRGLVSGAATEDVVARSILGSDELNGYLTPHQVLNYIEAHDNYNLNDLFWHLHPDDDEEIHLRRIEVANALNLLLQGMCFVQLGQEFGRTKLYPTGENGQLTQDDRERAMNSYNAPDEVNQVDWDLVTTNKEMVERLRNLIVLKTTDSAFSSPTFEEIRQKTFVNFADKGSGIIEFSVSGEKNYKIFFNNSGKNLEIQMTSIENCAIIGTNSKRFRLTHLELEPLTYLVLDNQN